MRIFNFRKRKPNATKEEEEEIRLLDGEDKISKDLGKRLEAIKEGIIEDVKFLERIDRNFDGVLKNYLNCEEGNKKCNAVMALEGIQRTLTEANSKVQIVKTEIERLIDIGNRVLADMDEDIKRIKKKDFPHLIEKHQKEGHKKVLIKKLRALRMKSERIIPEIQRKLDECFNELELAKNVLKDIKYRHIQGQIVEQGNINPLKLKIEISMGLLNDAAHNVAKMLVIIFKFKYYVEHINGKINHEILREEADRLLYSRV